MSDDSRDWGYLICGACCILAAIVAGAVVVADILF